MNCLICDAVTPEPVSWRTLFCRDPTPDVCGRCMGKFERITGPVCPHCGKASDGLCGDCAMWETSGYAGVVSGGRSLYTYNEAMRQFLHRYKFLQDAALAEVFSAELRKALKGEAIVPIPMNDKRLRERTFPQVDRLLDAARLPYRHYLTKRDSVQGKKTREERIAAPVLFTWNGEPVPARVTVVDDLYTTGATMRHAAHVLREAGAEEVRVFALIRG
ncbi:ComF family protein [Indiicoccus explosivorum]|uniref:ComF family protein n=1 Tax=Indiicoccus explosivorum TaxID=1917864 RepID=UPI001F4D69AE|nr:ComF family protein [Indiicoccus explosivorum]